jgi:hypothetical protein
MQNRWTNCFSNRAIASHRKNGGFTGYNIYNALIVLQSIICRLRGRSPKNLTMSFLSAVKNPAMPF